MLILLFVVCALAIPSVVLAKIAGIMDHPNLMTHDDLEAFEDSNAILLPDYKISLDVPLHKTNKISSVSKYLVQYSSCDFNGGGFRTYAPLDTCAVTDTKGSIRYYPSQNITYVADYFGPGVDALSYVSLRYRLSNSAYVLTNASFKCDNNYVAFQIFSPAQCNPAKTGDLRFFFTLEDAIPTSFGSTGAITINTYLFNTTCVGSKEKNYGEIIWALDTCIAYEAVYFKTTNCTAEGANQTFYADQNCTEITRSITYNSSCSSFNPYASVKRTCLPPVPSTRLPSAPTKRPTAKPRTLRPVTRKPSKRPTNTAKPRTLRPVTRKPTKRPKNTVKPRTLRPASKRPTRLIKK